MKKLLLLAIVVLFTVGFASKISAQSSVLVKASNTAGGEILAPLTLTANTPLEFGKLAITTAGGGTVTLTPAATTNVSTTGQVSLMTGTTRTAAKYTVGGTGSYVYTITVPTSDITIKSGLNEMQISQFKFASIESATLTGGTLTASGSDVFYVGGTLTVGSGQAVGAYTGSFDVSVNYN